MKLLSELIINIKYGSTIPKKTQYFFFFYNKKKALSDDHFDHQNDHFEIQTQMTFSSFSQ